MGWMFISSGLLLGAVAMGWFLVLSFVEHGDMRLTFLKGKRMKRAEPN